MMRYDTTEITLNDGTTGSLDIGEWRYSHPVTVGGLGQQKYGSHVFLRNADGDAIAHVFVAGDTSYEAETRNAIGGTGAYRDVPNHERLAAAVARLREKHCQEAAPQSA